jgi:hypothetical protein
MGLRERGREEWMGLRGGVTGSEGRRERGVAGSEGKRESEGRIFQELTHFWTQIKWCPYHSL